MAYFIVVLFVIQLHNVADTKDTMSESEKLVTSEKMTNVIQAIDLTLSFYKNNIDSTNLDGLFGVRIFEGVATRILKDCRKISQNYTVLCHTVENMLNKAQSFLEEGIEAVKRNHKESFTKLSPLISKPYIVNEEPRVIDKAFVWAKPLSTSDSFKVIDEEISDNCFHLLFNAQETSICSFTKKCVDGMLKPGLVSYPLLHQILFISLVDRTPSCGEKWKSFLPLFGYSSNSHLQTVFCSNSYHEMKGLVNITDGKDPFVTEMSQDLFFEHLFVCPSIGFYEFLEEKYLSIILSTQEESGCFTMQPKKIKVPSRSLLEEITLKDGCLFHKTAVALGALSQYLRFYILSSEGSELLKGQRFTQKAVLSMWNLTKSFELNIYIPITCLSFITIIFLCFMLSRRKTCYAVLRCV